MDEMPLSVGAVDICSQWSEWQNRDSPNDLFDNEMIYAQNRNDICSKPTAAQGRIKATQQMATTQNVQMRLNGLFCANNQNYGGCVDYEVRFCCPGNTFSLFKQ